jgi:hypothetical protein
MLVTLMAAVLLTPEPTFHAEFTLKPGVRYELLVRETRETAGRTVRDSTGRIMIEYHPDNANGFLAVTIEPQAPMTRAQAEAMGLALTDLTSTAKFKLGDSHELTHLENWKELGDQSLRVAAATMNTQIAIGQADRDTADRAMELLRSMVSNHDGVFAMYSKRIGPYIFGYGWELSPDAPITQQTQLTVPFSPDPIDSTMTTALADNPDTDRLVEYEMIQSPNADAVRAFFTQLMENIGGVADADQLVQDIKIEMKIEWTYSLDSKSIVSATATRTTEMPNQPSGIERWTWQLVTVP